MLLSAAREAAVAWRSQHPMPTAQLSGTAGVDGKAGTGWPALDVDVDVDVNVNADVGVSAVRGGQVLPPVTVSLEPPDFIVCGGEGRRQLPFNRTVFERAVSFAHMLIQTHTNPGCPGV